jgi:butyryl-CoA dehydrogenase
LPESLLINRRDLDFQLFEVLQAEALAQRPRHADHSRETFTAALDTAHTIAEEKFAPHNRASDEHEPTFENGRVRMIPEVREALDAFCAAGLLAPTKDYEQGGMQLPVVVAQACSALFKSANGATTRTWA